MPEVFKENPPIILAPPPVCRCWYAVYTQPQHEKSAEKFLGLKRIETFLPLYQVVHRWKNRCTKTLDLPLFPRYLFARFSVAERLHVLSSRGVISIVSSGREPVPLSDAEIEALKIGLKLRHAEPHPYLVVGRPVRIRTGALAGMEGILVRKKNSLRVVITLSLIRQSVAVEVDGADVEPLHVSDSVALQSLSGEHSPSTII